MRRHIDISFTISNKCCSTVQLGHHVIDCFSTSILIATFVKEDGEKGRLLRRTLIRYLVLCQVMVMRDVSTAVKKRFPTFDHCREAGTYPYPLVDKW